MSGHQGPSLAWRLSLLTGATMLAAAALGLGAQEWLSRRPTREALVQAVVRDLRRVQSALAATERGSARLRMARALSMAGTPVLPGNGGAPAALPGPLPGLLPGPLPAPAEWAPDLLEPLPPPGPPPLLDGELDAVRAGLPSGFALQPIPGPAGTSQWLARFELDGEVWLAALPAPPIGLLGPLGPWVAMLLAAVAAATLAGWQVRQRLERPLSRLAAQVRARRGSPSAPMTLTALAALTPLAVPAGAGPELHELCEAFNGLVRQLQWAQDSRRQMLAGLSHDLRTPLTRLQLRAECELPEDTAQRLTPDLDALARIIEQFLAYAQGTAGVLAGRDEPVVELVTHGVERYRLRAAVGLSVADGDWRGVLAPDLALQRVLDNLIGNALAHGRPPVDVVLELDESEWRVVVFDGGPGIAPLQFERALQPYVKLHGDSGDLGHCGLGLAIVAQVAAQLGGRVILRPFDGRRSGIGLALPCTSAEVHDAAATSRRAPPSRGRAEPA